MKKLTLFNHFVAAYGSELSREEYDDLVTQLLNFNQENKEDDLSKLVGIVQEKFPELSVMHDSYVRKKLAKISSSINTIKVIVIIYFIASIIVGILVALKV